MCLTMADRSTNGRVNGGHGTSDGESNDGRHTDAVQRYGPWVTLYGFLHRFVDHHVVVFGGSVVVGALVLVRQFYAFASESAKWSGLPSWTVVGGVVLFGFGVGYYVVRMDTSCPDCGTPFARERIDKQLVAKESKADGTDRMYVEETYECNHCGEQTTGLFSQPQWSHSRY